MRAPASAEDAEGAGAASGAGEPGRAGALASDPGGAGAPGPITAVSFISGLARTLAAANRFLMERLADQGITGLVPSHGDMLMCLFAEQPVSMQRLAAAINRDPSTVTALVKKLVAAGYVSTRKDDADRRVTLAELTPVGRELGQVIDQVSRELLEVQMRGIDAADFDATCRTLAQVRGNFLEALGGKAD